MSASELVTSELEKIFDKHGYLTAEVVVDELSVEGHPLHDRLTWDDQIAGARWRLVQAQQLIRSVEIERIDPSAPKVRRYLSIQPVPEQSRVYERTETVAADPTLRAMMLKSMERDWKALQAKYAHFEEFAAMVLSDVAESVSA